MATKTAKAWKPKNKVLLLRTCDQDMKSYRGFVWPKAGYVEAPDWNPTANCGNGLHGLLWGEGGAGHLSTTGSWLVVAAEQSEIIDLGGKHKFPRCVVVHCGDQQSATAHLIANGAKGKRVHYATVTGGDDATVTGGDDATVTGGDDAMICIQWYDDKTNRYRLAMAEVDNETIKANTPYIVRDGKLVEKNA